MCGGGGGGGGGGRKGDGRREEVRERRPAGAIIYRTCIATFREAAPRNIMTEVV